MASKTEVEAQCSSFTSLKSFFQNADLNVDENCYDARFYGDGTPNDPPLINVPKKLATDMHYKDDPQLATDVASQLDFNTPSRYEAVITVEFNDYSTWNWPILVGNRELTTEVEHFIDKYLPQIIKWDAIVEGKDPQKELKKWRDGDEVDYSWAEDVANTEISEDTRKYFNDNASWLPHIDRELSGSIDIETEGDWKDDW